jgi:hypothetical protein
MIAREILGIFFLIEGNSEPISDKQKKKQQILLALEHLPKPLDQTPSLFVQIMNKKKQ